jgi:hypothetical protein
MYKNGESALSRILELVEKCPKDFQSKCFEVLLSGYVQLEVGLVKPTLGATEREKVKQPSPDINIPPDLLLRFKTTAKRLQIDFDKLVSLFDFSVDPFGLHAVAISGKDTAEKSRNVALLAAAKSYFATGSWAADWQEVKTMCVDQNCYDMNNYSKNLKVGAGGWFKNVDSGKAIELSTPGIRAAEKLLKDLAIGSDT